MIKAQQFYTILCDNCNYKFMSKSGITASDNKEYLEGFASDEWHKDKDKIFCPECYSVTGNRSDAFNGRKGKYKFNLEDAVNVRIQAK